MGICGRQGGPGDGGRSWLEYKRRDAKVPIPCHASRVVSHSVERT